MLRLFKLTIASIAVAGCFQLDLTTSTEALAQGCTCGRGAGGVTTCREHEYGQPDLFYNFYVDPSCSSVGAQMYMAPGPVPAHVGHTYYTYQPFMPHEMLYKHKRTYHRYYDEGRGLTRTHIRYW
ncbi:MAG: hypothetical protein H6822_07610 [Planctomycetaceae bacterium]|nr:hypothetical protein [Planctomycetales bacterium]MCB9922031.1 hypothetical protein [Planctomycetaceae bacterium]